MKNSLLICAATASVAMLLASCQCNRSQTTDEFAPDTTANTVDNSTMQDDLNKSKTIIYTLPSPLEMASIIKESGVRYDEDLLHDLSLSEQYSSNLQMALNLGIYAADMSFASIFNENQRAVDYLNSLRSLTERLGIVQLLDEETIKELEEKRSSKDEILNIITEVYQNANAYLTENNRKNISVMVLIGGWTEGFYIALNLTDPARPNKALTERIIAQKMALNTVMSILSDTNADGSDADLNYVQQKMTEVKMIFDEVRIEDGGKVMANTDSNAHLTKITASSTGVLSPDLLELLKQKVTEVRNEFVTLQ